MTNSEKVINSSAITGSIHTPSMSESLLITHTDITEPCIATSKGGVAILHLHARNPDDGSPSPDAKLFMEFLPVIENKCDSVINITTGAG